ncbi:MAG: magnesium transporter [Myxococcota bacterium]|jgi:magnesium transporter|nr:magnesium transporter [Myxococcota bacterium]
MPSAAGNHPQYRLADTLRRLLRRNAIPNLRKVLARKHPVDIAAILNHFLPQERQRLLFFVGDDAHQAEVVACLPITDAADLLREMPFERTVILLREMSGDDRADLLAAFDKELAAKVLAAMPDEESDEVTELMRYGENTAGGIMSPDVLAIPSDTTAAEAIRILQNSPDVEMAFYIYVVNIHGSLVGVISLRQLVTARPDVTLKEIMNSDIVSVRTDMDQEEVARIVSRYALLAVPVVDETNKLVGVVTVDDVIDVIKEEATEDFLKMAGAGHELDERPSISASVRRRAPWLAAALVGGVGAAFVIGKFEDLLRNIPILIGFIPVINGMAGNVGTQSLTVIVRGLAMRSIEAKHFWRVVLREALTGALLGALYGLVIGGIASLLGYSQTNILAVSGIVAVSAMTAITLAATFGTIIPLVFARIGIDPAVATGPFLTSFIDALGVFIFVTLAQALL